MSVIVKVGKKVKNVVTTLGFGEREARVSYTRRIESIKTDKRICAMTFDDGPMNMSAVPDERDGKAMTAILLDALAKYGAHATFDIIGSTEENYPDTAGSVGSASWGGIKYDHYPDIGCDRHGGAVNAPELVRRMIDEGHELANHGFRHVIFGKKPFVYGAREHFHGIDEVIADLTKLDTYVKENFDYEIKLSRPPHYVDRIGRGLTSYDAYALMGYGYMAASFDGGGWLPLSNSESEIAAMTDVIERELEHDPDAFCGKIIFGKDGYNMAKRTPVAYALEKQLELLYKNGYTVMSVSELMRESPFADVGRECPMIDRLIMLAETRAIAYSDNSLKLDRKMTNFEYSMLVAPRKVVVDDRIRSIKNGGKYYSEYDAALAWAKKHGAVDVSAKGNAFVKSIETEKGREYSDDGFSRYDVFKRAKICEQNINENASILV